MRPAGSDVTCIMPVRGQHIGSVRFLQLGAIQALRPTTRQ
jgi:hypothetical protein